MKTLMFDMDGPLTKSKTEIAGDIAAALYRATSRARLVLVSGSTLQQIHKQLGHTVGFFHEVHYNSGNYYDGEKWNYMRDELENLLPTFDMWRGEIIGPKFDWRAGCFNYAACGQNATPELRNEYSWWSDRCGERLRLASILESEYPEFRATIGGSVSIDVVMRGCGKEQISVQPDTTFFCDSLGPHGGDELLARKVLECGGSVVYSRSPADTLRIISGESFL